jgi:hypothetical protein
MALVYADGFDHYGDGANLALVWGGGLQVSNVAGNARTGNGSVFVGDSRTTGFIGIVVQDEIYCGLGLNVSSAIFNMLGIQLSTSTVGSAVRVGLGANNRIQVRNAANALVAETAANVYSPGSYGYLEVYAKRSTGDVIVRLNNAVVLTTNVTGQGANGYNFVSIGTWEVSGFFGGTFRMDDFYIADTSGTFANTFLGDIRCRTIFPDANGAVQDWTSSNANPAWQNLDNVPPVSTTDYISSDLAGEVATFSLSDLPANVGTIYGAVINSLVRKTDAGTCQVNTSLTRAGSTAVTNDINPGTGDGFYRRIVTNDPVTGLPFTRANFNNTQLRLERTA